MLTSYLISKNYKPLSAVYIPDYQLDLKNAYIAIDGGLSTVFTPILSGNNDFSINNYSIFNLTSRINLKDYVNVLTPIENYRITTGLIFNTQSNERLYLRFTEDLDNNIAGVVLFDQTVDTVYDELTDLNFFEVEMTDQTYATVSKLYNDSKYFLSYDPSNLNLSFTILSAFNINNDFTRKFNYTYNSNTGVLTLHALYRGRSYRVRNNPATKRLELINTDSLLPSEITCVFYLTAFKGPDIPALTIDWGSYIQDFNQNNIILNSSKSKYDLHNNFLLNAEYTNFADNRYQLNILTLKNQLNIENNQGRGNVFISDEEVNYRHYNIIASGGKQERGNEKLHLQYESYSTPYLFKQGMTTWLHMPQNTYPYERLNVADANLIEAGAIAGDHPLRSDKIFKKVANYKSMSNYGFSRSEQTGQWLCSWLSGAEDIKTRPVWMDRYYNPATQTAFRAMTASPGSVTYISSYDCLNIPVGVVDVPSSMTFDSSCLYAYTHIGQKDALENIKFLSGNLQKKNFDGYLRPSGQFLDPDQQDIFTTYEFKGDELAYFDVSKFTLPTNDFTLSFWMYNENWSMPSGYQILGNYNDYGIGIYNHQLVTPFLFYRKNNQLLSLNRDFELLNVFDSGINKFGAIKYTLRRDPLNSFHCITNTKNILEFDIKETLIDASSALSINPAPIIKDVYNDDGRVYVLYTNNSVESFSVFTNTLLPVNVDHTIGNSADIKEIVKLIDGTIALVAGTNTKVRSSRVYLLSSGSIKTWDTSTEKLSTFAGNNSTTNFTTFNIDPLGRIWAGKNNTITIYGDYQSELFTVSLSADSSISTIPVQIKNITFIENFYSGSLARSVVVTASGSDTQNAILYRLDYSGKVELIKTLNTGGDFDFNLDPSNHEYNYSHLLARFPQSMYTFKMRLYNQFNTEDVEIPIISILTKDLGKGWHHFTYRYNSEKGLVSCFLDGSLYDEKQVTPEKYSFIPLVVNRFFAGASPFYSGLAMYDILDKFKTVKTAYTCKNLKIQNLYFYNKPLSYYEINMLFKERKVPKDLTWDVPSGRRNFMDVATRFFKQRLPGSKSVLYNVYINDNLLDQDCKDYLTVAITNKLKEISPAYTKLNSLNWVTTVPTTNRPYEQPYFSGNTLS